MTENIHCGKHDKIFTEKIPCPGCETEKQAGSDKPPESESKPEPEPKKNDDADPEPAHGKRGRPVR